jgi:hypothetical protein
MDGAVVEFVVPKYDAPGAYGITPQVAQELSKQ